MLASSENTITQSIEGAKILSPRRNSSSASDIEMLAREQLEHFHIAPDSEHGRLLLYRVQGDIGQLWAQRAALLA
ncbi:hypothetical protein [Microbulbifer halophilus]|uniref:Uncharacterized protein n=1 Tax=Microbulbifer halophilus TaxID=453963 RepID=A0ABW5EDB4_9GAMM|nr:hypothetical protein [Microbulbifer halophilus]MCW8125696.1 hypothetical protein [Microbulbifer halophilus]